MFGSDPLANPKPLIRRVYAYVAYRVGDGPEAEDVTSTVFENAVRYLDTYDSAKGEPIAWLLGIARRCIAQAKVGQPEAARELDDAPAPGDLEAEAVERLALQAALNSLSERDHDLISLRYGADLRARQIAELTGSTTNAVEVALHRALGRLREALEAGGRGETLPTLDPAERAV